MIEGKLLKGFELDEKQTHLIHYSDSTSGLFLYFESEQNDIILEISKNNREKKGFFSIMVNDNKKNKINKINSNNIFEFLNKELIEESVAKIDFDTIIEGNHMEFSYRINVTFLKDYNLLDSFNFISMTRKNPLFKKLENKKTFSILKLKILGDKEKEEKLAREATGWDINSKTFQEIIELNYSV